MDCKDGTKAAHTPKQDIVRGKLLGSLTASASHGVAWSEHIGPLLQQARSLFLNNENVNTNETPSWKGCLIDFPAAPKIQRRPEESVSQS